jgi:hypothetical protein
MQLSLFMRVRNFAKIDSALSRRSVRMKQLGSNRTDFHEILCLSIFRKSVDDPKVSLKLNNNNGTVLSVKRNILL